MKNNRVVLAIGAIGVLISAGYTVLKTSGSHPGSTGAPGELTCAQSTCHVDAQVQQDNGLVNTLLFTSPDTTYVPGESYTLTLQVAKAMIQKFGFELVALKDSTNTNIGTFTPIETTRTQKINHVAPGNDLRYSMTHKTAGTTTATPGAIQWKMKWTAPSANVGTITFWYATNCTNNNGFSSGDGLFLSSFRIKPVVEIDTTDYTGINELASNKNFSAYYNADSKALNVKFSSDKKANGKLLLYDVNGKLIGEHEIDCRIGEQTQKLNFSEEHAAGTYIIKLVLDNEKAYTTKILIE